MNAINLFSLILVHALLAQAGSDFSACLSSSIYSTLSSYVANIADKQSFCCSSTQCGTKSPTCPFILESLDGQCIKVGQSKVCVVQGLYFGLPGDECGGIIGTTSPTNITVGTCPSYDAIGNALVGSATAPTLVGYVVIADNGGWSCTGSIGSVIADLTQAIGDCTLQLLLPILFNRVNGKYVGEIEFRVITAIVIDETRKIDFSIILSD
ncbi:22076_t:CDS:2 [Dentiscutata erythropus]|uniref:22076_t:CDS:1 n=1 Tax=Dentiscutata erythropus TaxID=1348616 RepID=A0A9N9H5A7_9GLOM|nr:22076_t:CDS:2 [Dentiscutata erythropus]